MDSTANQVYSQRGKKQEFKGGKKGGKVKGNSKDMILSQRMYPGESKPRFEGQCHVCGKTGHKQSECRRREGGKTGKGKWQQIEDGSNRFE